VNKASKTCITTSNPTDLFESAGTDLKLKLFSYTIRFNSLMSGQCVPQDSMSSLTVLAEGASLSRGLVVDGMVS